MNISFENISAIYWDWLHLLDTRSAVKILKVSTTSGDGPIKFLRKLALFLDFPGHIWDHGKRVYARTQVRFLLNFVFPVLFGHALGPLNQKKKHQKQ